jgi:proline iminopeptidase
MNGQIVSDGFTLQYRLSGTGIPTLVVGSSIYYDRSFSQELRTKLHMVFIDHRGFAPANDCQDTDKYQLDLLVDPVAIRNSGCTRSSFYYAMLVNGSKKLV